MSTINDGITTNRRPEIIADDKADRDLLAAVLNKAARHLSLQHNAAAAVFRLAVVSIELTDGRLVLRWRVPPNSIEQMALSLAVSQAGWKPGRIVHRVIGGGQ